MRSGLQSPGAVPLLAVLVAALLSITPNLCESWMKPGSSPSIGMYIFLLQGWAQSLLIVYFFRRLWSWIEYIFIWIRIDHITTKRCLRAIYNQHDYQHRSIVAAGLPGYHFNFVLIQTSTILRLFVTTNTEASRKLKWASSHHSRVDTNHNIAWIYAPSSGQAQLDRALLRSKFSFRPTWEKRACQFVQPRG